MAFQKKVWQSRVSDYPNRRLLISTDGTFNQVVTVTRDEGTITTPGDAFSADNMNDLEDRIEAAITTSSEDIANLQTSVSSMQGTLSNAIIGSGATGNLARFDSEKRIVSGPRLGTSTTTFLRNDGTWQVPTPGKATTTADGLMSKEDKVKVDGLGTQVTYSLSGTTLRITTK